LIEKKKLGEEKMVYVLFVNVDINLLQRWYMFYLYYNSNLNICYIIIIV